jgi:hypothetical protein
MNTRSLAGKRRSGQFSLWLKNGGSINLAKPFDEDD